jgi:uncharacterized protein YbjT (DUF2867 family)
MILVTGGTGVIGSEVVKQLSAAGQKVRVLARNPAKMEAIPNVEPYAADMLKPETLGPALEGVDKIFLLAPAPEIPRMEANVIDAARKAGVKHIVKLSVINADADPGIQVSRWHKESERRLQASEVPWTSIQPTVYTSNDLMWAGSVKAEGTVYNASGTGGTGIIDTRDIAAVAVKVLTTPGHEGKTYTITGPESLSVPERVKILSEALGRELKVVDITLDQARQGILSTGAPQAFADALTEYLGFIKDGRDGAVTNGVEEVLGRKPYTYAEWVRANLSVFR